MKGLRIRIETAWRQKWVRLTAVALAIPTVLIVFAAAYYYVSFARMIDQRLQGALERIGKIVVGFVHRRPGRVSSDRRHLLDLDEDGGDKLRRKSFREEGAKGAGFDGFVSKPINLKEFIAAIAKAVQKDPGGGAA